MDLSVGRRTTEVMHVFLVEGKSTLVFSFSLPNLFPTSSTAKLNQESVDMFVDLYMSHGQPSFDTE
jgi:hypothetical protein